MPPPRSLIVPQAAIEHDLREVAWWMVQQILKADLDAQRAGALVSLMRLISSLGPEPMALEEALAEVELRGLIMHGIPPRNAEEWERASRIFSADSLAEFKRRHSPRYGDGSYVSEPLDGGERGTGDGHMALVVEEEDRR